MERNNVKFRLATVCVSFDKMSSFVFYGLKTYTRLTT